MCLVLIANLVPYFRLKGISRFTVVELVLVQKVEAARARVESLNPLVTVETLATPLSLEADALDTLVHNVDMVCVTDTDKESLVSYRVSALEQSLINPAGSRQ